MKKRIMASLLGALVYAVVYANFEYRSEGTIAYTEVVLGAVAFFVVFYLSRVLLDTWRAKRVHSQEQDGPKARE